MARSLQSLLAIPRAVLLLAVGAALAAGGCSSSCQDRTPETHASAGAAPAPAPASTPDEASDASGMGADGLIDVAAGEALVQVENGRVTLVANAYPQLGLLGKLGRAAGFESASPRARKQSADVTVRLKDVTVEEAIAAVLTGLSFQIHYRFDEAQKRSVLSEVTLGRGQRERIARARQRRGRGPDDRGTPRASRSVDPRERAEDLRRTAELEAKRGEEIEVGLASGDDEERAEAVDRLRPEGEEFETLKDLLVNDPSPEVRALAAERLEASDGGTAIEALVTALNDPDTRVVLAAIDALEFAADSEHIPMILASGADRHPDPEVREAFSEMIDFLE